MREIFRSSLRPAYEFVFFLLKTSWHWILVFHVLSFIGSEYFEAMAKAYEMSTYMMIICRLGEALSTMLMVFLLTLIVPARWMEKKYSLPHRSLGALLKKYTVPLVLEGLRVMVRVLLYTLMLILPGIFQYWRTTLVPLIVVMNQDYDKGRLDAIKHSHALIKGHDFPYVLILIFLAVLDMSPAIGAGFIEGIFKGLSNSNINVSVELIISLLLLPLSLYSYSLLVEIYSGLEKLLLTKNSGGN